MPELTKTTEQLQNEIASLRRQNRTLMAQLNFHQKVFREVHSALGAAAREWNPGISEEDALRKLMAENAELKNQLKVFRLTGREREVLALIVKGLTSKEIAGHLKISKLTVDTHRKHIQRKLEVPNTVELIKLAILFDLP
ncbi:MAG: LuxR C-terminal-related transcriptional regulator [Saprospiraceae bacterium]